MMYVLYLITHPRTVSVLYNYHTLAVFTINIVCDSTWIQGLQTILCCEVLHKSPIKPVSQFARQADDHTRLDVVGEIICFLHRGNSNFSLGSLMVKTLDIEILTGNPFLNVNNIATLPQNDSWSWEVRTLSARYWYHMQCVYQKSCINKSAAKTKSDYAWG